MMSGASAHIVMYGSIVSTSGCVVQSVIGPYVSIVDIGHGCGRRCEAFKDRGRASEYYVQNGGSEAAGSRRLWLGRPG
jgi:hypothetical protein